MNSDEGDGTVIVIGAGPAGMAAALHASAGGARRVLLVEAAEEIGGALHLSSGQMSAAGTRIQAAKGIVDSPEAHYADIMRISYDTANPTFVRLATDHAADTLHWLLDNGLELLPDHPIIHFGHEPYTTARTYWGPEEGRSVLNVLAPMVERAVAEGRIELRLSTRLAGLERGKDDTIAVQLECAGERQTLVSPAVVLASGGFSANPDLFRRLSGGNALYGGGYAFSKGEGLEAALALGGTVMNENTFLPTFAGVADASAAGGVTFATNTYPQFRQPWELYVDPDGNRFMREDDPNVDARERKLLALPGMRFWALYDEGIRVAAPSFFIEPQADDPAARFNRVAGYARADSLSELAAMIGVEPATLERSVAEYNDALRTGAADRFGREHRPLPLVQAPFYAIEHFGWSIVSFAGLGVDGELRVIDGAGAPIPGLYAAGEILGLGATSGNSFAGGMSVTPAMTFGRLLGERMAQGEAMASVAITANA